MFYGNEIAYLKSEIYNLRKGLPEFVECDVCGCLLNKENAFKGEAMIGKEERFYYWDAPPVLVDVIKYPSYCKIHIPKVKK